MPNILFVAAGRRVAMAELFKDTWVKNAIFGYELQSQCPLATVAEKIHVTKRFSPFNFNLDIDNINSAIAESKIDLVIPFSCESAAWLAHHAHFVDAPVLACPGSKVCNDKELFAYWFKSEAITSLYPWPKVGEMATFKPSGGFGSKGIYHKIFAGECPEGHVAQKKLTGAEYSADCYFDKDGHFVTGAVRERLVVAGGEVLDSKIIRCPSILDAVERIGKVIPLRGPICAQFMGAEDGTFKILEINARFGGGAPLSIYAGLLFHEWVVLEYIEKRNLADDWVECYGQEPKYGASTTRFYQDCFWSIA